MGKKIGHVVGFGVFVGHTVWKIAQFVILLVTDRKMIARKQVLVVLLGLNLIDRNKKKGKIRREKLVVRFDSFYVTDENTIRRFNEIGRASLNLLI